MSGPVPSNIVLLSDLGKCAPGMKVRFLGCVDDYVVQTATVRLKHRYPTSSSSTASTVANVNVDHVLEKLKHHTLDVGTWLNVIGYVEHRKEKGVFVQAVTVWDAGDVDVEAYERAVEKRKEVA